MKALSSIFIKAPISEFARTLAEDIAKRYPPELDKQPGKRPSVNRLTRIMEDASNKAVAFQDQHGLGWIGKAALGNAFRWELSGLGYQKDFVDFATEAIVIIISRNKNKKSI